MKKKIPFIIGLGQKASAYRSLSKYFNIIQPDWNNGSLAKLKLGKPSVLAGFSLGAMIATMHAEKYKVKTLILCSPTPDESLAKIKADLVIFLVGEKETWCLQNIKRVVTTLPPETKWDIRFVFETGHKINKEYRKNLIAIDKLLNLKS